MTWTVGWNNLEKWRDCASKVIFLFLFLDNCYFSCRIIVNVTKNVELFYVRLIFHRCAKFSCQFGTSRKTDVPPTFHLQRLRVQLSEKFLC